MTLDNAKLAETMKVDIRYEFEIQNDDGDYEKKVSGYLIANNIQNVNGKPHINQTLQVTVNHINETYDQSIFSDLANMPEVQYYDPLGPEDIEDWIQCDLLREGHLIESIWYDVTETETDVTCLKSYVNIWYDEIPLSEAEKMRILGIASLF